MNEDDEKIAAEKPDAGSMPKHSSARADRDVGQALRSVYIDMVAEDVPADILDLLGKLD